MASGIYRADGSFQPFQATGLTTELATRQNAGLTPGELEGWLNVLPALIRYCVSVGMKLRCWRNFPQTTK